MTSHSGFLQFVLLAVLVSSCQGGVPHRSAGDDATSQRSGGSGEATRGGGGTAGTTDLGPSVEPQPPSMLTCDSAAKPAELPLRRLSALQYRNAIDAAVSVAIKDEAVRSTIRGSLLPMLDKLSDDERPKLPGDDHGTFRRVDQTVQQANVDETYDVALSLGMALTTPTVLPKLLGDCSTQANSSACLEAFFRRFASRLLRRPVADDQMAFLKSVYGNTSKIDSLALADVIGALLLSPQFIYFVEMGGNAVAGDTRLFSLDPYELASRLSFHFWDSPPDDALWASAESGKLLDETTLREQVDRLLADPRSVASMDRFYDEWLLLEEVPALDGLNTDPFFKTFANGMLPKPTLRNEMLDEIMELTRHLTWNSRGKFDDLLTTDLAFPRGGQLAQLYGIAQWNGTGEPPRFAAGARPGVLTRAAKLVHREGITRPILRGTLIRKKMLCDEIPPPPANAMDAASKTAATLKADMSTRQRTEALTETSSPSCASCHQTLINPLGYALEGFDALGRSRTQERVIDSKGSVIASPAVDTTSRLQIDDDDKAISHGPMDLAKQMSTSPKARQCFERHYLRFALGRAEDTAKDGCTLAALDSVVTQGGSLRDTFRALALTSAFRQKSF